MSSGTLGGDRAGPPPDDLPRGPAVPPDDSSPTASGPSRRAWSVPVVVVVVLVVLALVRWGGGPGSGLPGLPGGDDGDEAVRETRLSASLGVVTGRLDRSARERVREDVRRVVARWVATAYVGDGWPRGRAALAFPGFTPGAAAQARDDRALLSNADLDDRLQEVLVRRHEVTLDVLARDGRPQAVTARLVLGMRLTGDVERDERVTGSLYLTRTGQDWRVLGYDVRRGRVA